MPSPPAPLPEGEGSVSKKFELGYAYAANGNMTAKSVYDADTGALTDAWTYSYANHAAVSITTTQAGARFSMQYDAAGNMITQSDSAKNLAKQMAYDSYNRIRQVTDLNTGTVKGQYYYDDQGFRVRRSARYEVDGQELQVELLYPSMYFSVETQKDLQGNPVGDTGFGVNNIYLNGVRVAAVLPNCDAQYYLTDQVDSVKVVTNDSGLVVTSHEYLPFGEDWITEGDTKNAPKYNSQELDKESGYYFYNARHYDPEIARFVTPDTVIDGELSTQGWNRFSYVHNNPIRYKDPTGHFATFQGENGNQLRNNVPPINNVSNKPDSVSTKSERLADSLIKANTVDGARKYISTIKVPPGTNLKEIAEGLNNYYKTDIFNVQNIAEINNIKDPNKIVAGKTLKVDPAEIAASNYMVNIDNEKVKDSKRTEYLMMKYSKSNIMGGKRLDMIVQLGQKLLGNSPESDRDYLYRENRRREANTIIGSYDSSTQKRQYTEMIKSYFENYNRIPTKEILKEEQKYSMEFKNDVEKK